jgi:L-ascorbate metabolism protein UlaG (beta-lactamase superfamily)
MQYPSGPVYAHDCRGCRARTVVPMHYDGFGSNPWYHPIGDAARRFEAVAAGRQYQARLLQPGESLEPISVAS